MFLDFFNISSEKLHLWNVKTYIRIFLLFDNNFAVK